MLGPLSSTFLFILTVKTPSDYPKQKTRHNHHYCCDLSLSVFPDIKYIVVTPCFRNTQKHNKDEMLDNNKLLDLSQANMIMQ